MHNTLQIQDYVFDTVALRDAVETIDLQEAPAEIGYSEDSLYALFDYFCDWGPVRESDINATAAEELSSIASGEQEALFGQCCDELAENLRVQYSVDVTADTVARLARLLSSEEPDAGRYDFLLRYLWRYSKHLQELDPEENQNISDIQDFLNETRQLPSEFLAAKESQYAGSVKVNKIRYRLLQKFHADGEISASVLENIKTEVMEEEEDTTLPAWRNYTILGQIYYDYFKPRIDHYLEALAQRMVNEFDDLDLTSHVVNFQGARNFLSDFAWIAAYPADSGSQKDSYQLYLGIHAEHLSYGLHVGDNLREGDWESTRDIDRAEHLDPTRFSDVLAKLQDVEPAFRQLENLKNGEPPPGPEIERPDRAEEIVRQLRAKKQVVFYGPPGTGKTYTAQQFAQWWIAEQDTDITTSRQVRTVTFHPSFTYEDFIEGLSAESTDDGEVTYEVKDGILKAICKAASTHYRSTDDGEEAPRYVLIIDEINRGNLAQIFGETITLLEADKRGTVTTQLAHSNTEFTIPPNLYVIGTMNTADQSIALVDTALRRRFRLIDFPPDLDVVWGEYELTAADPYAAVTESRDGVSQREQLLGASVLAVKELNERILRAPELGKGKQLGHTYLLDHASAIEVVDAWRYDILPQLEEYYFSQFDRLRDDLLNEAGDLLIDWETERMQPFGSQELYTALCRIAGIDDPAPLAETVQPVITDGDDTIDARDAWEAGDKTVDAFRERIERTLDSDARARVERVLEVGEELGWLDTGRGDYNASVQIKSESVDPGVGPLQVDQDGEIDFRWGWLTDRDENDLTGEFIDDAATVFNEIDGYAHEWQPESGEDGEFITPTLDITSLSDEDMDVLIEGLRSFVKQADEFQND